MKVTFARSDEENERIRKKNEEEKRIYNEVLRSSSFNNNIKQPVPEQDQANTSSNLKLLR